MIFSLKTFMFTGKFNFILTQWVIKPHHDHRTNINKGFCFDWLVKKWNNKANTATLTMTINIQQQNVFDHLEINI
tara:strand:+ start:254 stop:478 length:225 start_codon:yes stop_codon:yes gene_type:complete